MDTWLGFINTNANTSYVILPFGKIINILGQYNAVAKQIFYVCNPSSHMPRRKEMASPQPQINQILRHKYFIRYVFSHPTVKKITLSIDSCLLLYM